MTIFYRINTAPIVCLYFTLLLVIYQAVLGKTAAFCLSSCTFRSLSSLLWLYVVSVWPLLWLQLLGAIHRSWVSYVDQYSSATLGSVYLPLCRGATTHTGTQYTPVCKITQAKTKDNSTKSPGWKDQRYFEQRTWIQVHFCIKLSFHFSCFKFAFSFFRLHRK